MLRFGIIACRYIAPDLCDFAVSKKENAHDWNNVAITFGLEVIRAAYSDSITFSNNIFDDHFGLNESFASFANVICEIISGCVFELSSVSVCAIRRQDVFEDVHFAFSENVHEESAYNILVCFYSHSIYPTFIFTPLA
jgi:hypothetical protein